VNAFAPGSNKTPMHPPEIHQTLAAIFPMGTMSDLQNIVDALLCFESTDFVTGKIVNVHGGQSAGR
jgi:hypothetical protein